MPGCSSCTVTMRGIFSISPIRRCFLPTLVATVSRTTASTPTASRTSRLLRIIIMPRRRMVLPLQLRLLTKTPSQLRPITPPQLQTIPLGPEPPPITPNLPIPLTITIGRPPLPTIIPGRPLRLTDLPEIPAAVPAVAAPVDADSYSTKSEGRGESENRRKGERSFAAVDVLTKTVSLSLCYFTMNLTVLW